MLSKCLQVTPETSITLTALKWTQQLGALLMDVLSYTLSNSPTLVRDLGLTVAAWETHPWALKVGKMRSQCADRGLQRTVRALCGFWIQCRQYHGRQGNEFGELPVKLCPRRRIIANRTLQPLLDKRSEGRILGVVDNRHVRCHHRENAAMTSHVLAARKHKRTVTSILTERTDECLLEPFPQGTFAACRGQR